MKRLGLLLSIIILIVTGCGNKDANTINSNVNNDADIEATSVKEITLFYSSGGGALNYAFDNLLKEAALAFESQQQNVKIILDNTISDADYQDTLLQRIDSGSSPDIIFVPSNMIKQYDERKLLTDLGVYAMADNLPMDDFYQPLLERVTREGRWLSVPYLMDPNVVFYNKEWFDEAKIPYPDGEWTWEEFNKIALQLKESRQQTGANQYGAVLGFDIFWMEPFIKSNGGQILSPDGSQASGYLDSPKTVEAVQFVVDMFKSQQLEKDYSDPSNFFTKLDHFNNLNAGMTFGGSTVNYYATPYLGEKLGIAPLPKFADGIRANPLYMNGLSILEGSDHKDLAWEFIRMISLDDNEITKKFSQWMLMNRESMAEVMGQQEDPIRKVFLDELNAIAVPTIDQNEFYGAAVMNTEIGTMFNDLVLQDIDVKQQLTQIAKLIDVKLAEQAVAAVQEQ
jgi:multiple sugar transport system substrate-binding protein